MKLLLSNIRNWLQNRNSSQLPVAQRSLSFSQAWLRGEEAELAGAKMSNALQQSVWVYGCVTAISEQIAHTPFVFSLGEKGGERRVDQGAAVELFNQPDPQMDRYVFWDLVCQWLLLRGKCYIVVLDAAGAVLPLQAGRAVPSAPHVVPNRLVLLNPDRVRPLRAGHELAGYHYDAAPHDPIGSQSFLPEEVINLRMAYAYDYLEGLPPLGVALLAAQTDYASAQLMKGLVLNNADSGLIVTTREALTDEQKMQVLAALRERKRAAGTADRPLFLTDNCKVQTPPLSLADLQFLENRKFNRQEICAIFRVPQEILGYTEDANRAVAEAVRLNFIEHRIAPLCHRLESAVAPIVKMFGAEVWGVFDWESLPVMQAARRMRFQSARQGFEMGVPLNVLNQVFDLGLPRLAHGDVSFLPGNFEKVGETRGDAEARRGMGERQKAAGSRENGRWAMGDGRWERLEELLGVFERGNTWRGELARRLEGRLSKFFFEQRGRTLQKLRIADCRMQNGSGIFDVAGENERLAGRLRPLVAANLEECVRERQKEAPEFRLSESDRAAFVEEREVAWREINEMTRAALEEAFEGGTEGLVKRVKGVFQLAGDCRARELAEREAGMGWSYVQNLGVLAGEKEE